MWRTCLGIFMYFASLHDFHFITLPFGHYSPCPMVLWLRSCAAAAAQAACHASSWMARLRHRPRQPLRSECPALQEKQEVHRGSTRKALFSPKPLNQISSPHPHPNGRFLLYLHLQVLVAVGAGVGVTPFISLLSTLLAELTSGRSHRLVEAPRANHSAWEPLRVIGFWMVLARPISAGSLLLDDTRSHGEPGGLKRPGAEAIG